MRLKNRNTEPPGGWRYKYQDEHNNWYRVPVSGSATSLKDLIKRVGADMRVNSVIPPSNLQAYIEDYICAHLKGDKCLYDDGLGDTVAKLAHNFFGGVDSAMAKIGVKSNLQQKARKCTSCGKRRAKLNGY